VVGVARTLVEVRAVYKVDADAVVVDVAQFNVAREGVVVANMAGFADFFRNLRIERQNDAHVLSRSMLGKRQGAQNVGQAAGFDERVEF
jgi:hypothetical protein